MHEDRKKCVENNRLVTEFTVRRNGQRSMTQYRVSIIHRITDYTLWCSLTVFFLFKLVSRHSYTVIRLYACK